EPGWTGVAEITAIVDDGNGNTHPRTFFVGFNEVGNDPPALEDIPTQLAEENTPLLFELVANDPNGDPLTYEVEVLSGNVTPSITGTELTLDPEDDWSGIATIQVKVTDEKGGISTQTFDVGINEDGNNRPNLPDIPDQILNEDDTLTIPYLATDLDEDNLTYSFEVEPTEVHVIDTGNGFIVEPETDWSGTATVTVTVTDDKGGIDFETFIIDIPPVNDPPTNIFPISHVTVDNLSPSVFSFDNNSEIRISDKDSEEMTVTLEVGNGTLTLPDTTEVTFLNNTTNEGNLLTITGTIDQINTAINGLEYVPDEGFVGLDNLTITTEDNETLLDQDTVPLLI
ncbi:MAG: hypothetical protein EB156_05915, partial [Euryarchaeota archaeon]|nr:hypothetical protein [Euryarchaeota archaeon]NDG22163.1 hypothetical protein [Euryarchaeota archaeon]